MLDKRGLKRKKEVKPQAAIHRSKRSGDRSRAEPPPHRSRISGILSMSNDN